MKSRDDITNNIKPCPMCHLPMQIRQTESYETEIEEDAWFFVYCRGCGYGPNQAFHSSLQAVQQWNQITL